MLEELQAVFHFRRGPGFDLLESLNHEIASDAAARILSTRRRHTKQEHGKQRGSEKVSTFATD